MNEAARCLYCGGTENLGAEHLVPRTRGGRDIPENFFRACRGCNAAKSDRLPSEWRDDLPAEVYEFERRALDLHPETIPRPRRDERQVQTAIRLPASLMARLDKLAEHMSAPGFRVTRAEVLRLAASQGVEKIERIAAQGLAARLRRR